MVKSQAYLKKLIKEMKFGQEKTMPMAQGMSINEVIKRYKIPAKAWGYNGSAIGVETNKQKILWRDRGTHLDFLGIVNKIEEDALK